MTDTRKTYVQVGVGARSGCFTRAITQTYPEHCRMLAVCDTNTQRMKLCNAYYGEKEPIAMYPAEAFDKMITEHKPDVVIVSSIDSTHCEYICRALELGCDVITEKPMTTDAASCCKILKTMKRTGKDVLVTFNCRYAPFRAQIKKMLSTGTIGEIHQVDLQWTLDTKHGADYFRRWHRKREFSGSLLVHKSTHHFDLVNWWIDDVPEEVFAHGSLNYYKPETADMLGLTDRGERCSECPAIERCHMMRDFRENEGVKKMYFAAEKEDGYIRDRCVFGNDIDIWDTMTLNVKYRSGILLNYSLVAYSPYEGYRIAFTGNKGRIEHVTGERMTDSIVPGETVPSRTTITHFPHFTNPVPIEPETGEGNHSGADPLLVADLFSPDPPADPLGRKAGCLAGAYAVLIGAAAAESIDSGKPVRISELLGDQL